MAVQDRSPEYIKYLDSQLKCRHCFEGESTIHAYGKTYLPGFEGDGTEVDNLYDNYLNRALFYNTFARSIEFFKGLILKKDLVIKDKELIKSHLENVNDDDMSFRGFSSEVVEEVLKVGFGGILVEYDSLPEEVTTLKEAKALGLRPKMKWYPGESIINTRKNIRLLEKEYSDEDEFDDSTVDQIRVLDLDEEGFYRQRLYRIFKDKNGKESWIQYGPDVYPMINNTMLKEIPFYPCNADKNSLQVSKPPLSDLADVSIHHYGVYADYRNGIHFTGFPQLYVAGIQGDKANLTLGSGLAWRFEEPTASVKYAEFHGKGLEHPEKLLDRLEGYMGKIGARMLIADKNRAESAEKANIDSESEGALLSSIAKNCAEALTKALNMYLRWNGSGVVSQVELNTDYRFDQLSPATLIALMKGVQAGLLTEEVFLYNVKKGELIPDDKSLGDLLNEIHDHQEKLKKELLEKEAAGIKSKDPNALSERNQDDMKDPEDELRDSSRKKTDYGLRK